MTYKRRRNLLDHAYLYVFSYDVEPEIDRQHIGFVPGGQRINIFCKGNRTRAYHILREPTIGGFGSGSITGKLSWGGDRLILREDDVEISHVRMLLHTDDGADIEIEYESVSWLGPDGFRRFAGGKGRYGSERNPVDWPLITAPRFWTVSPLYSWLAEHQGLGVGRVQLVDSEVRRITYDVYVMT